MASNNKLSGAILVILLLLLRCTFLAACGPCKSKPPPAKAATCPRDALKLGACINLLGLVNLPLGAPVSSQCCPLIQGLANLEAAVCLCTAIKVNALGINLNVPVALSLLVSACAKSVPPGFQCR